MKLGANTETIKAAALVAGVGLAAVLVARAITRAEESGSLSENAPAMQKLSAGMVGAVNDLFAGLIKGIGVGVGVGDTDVTQCEIAKRAGDDWEASVRCPAKDYIAWILAGRPQHGASGSW